MTVSNINLSGILTDKFSIKMSDVDRLFVRTQITRYTTAFNKLYKNIELIVDPFTAKKIQHKYNISAKGYESLVADVLQQKEFFDGNQERVRTQIKEIQHQLKSDYSKRRETPKDEKYVKLSRNHKRNARKRIEAKLVQTKKNPCWGGKKLYRELQTLSDKLKSLKVTDKDYTETKEKRYLKLVELREARRHNLYYKGTAAAKGSRFFDLCRLNEGVVTYKPENQKERVNITFEIKGAKQQRKYDILQNLINEKRIPITIRLNEEYICVSYDTKLIHNTTFNDKKLIKAQKEIVRPTKKEKSEANKVVFQLHARQYEDDLTQNKVRNRFAALDLNPSAVGLCILDKKDDGKYDVVAVENYDIEGITRNGVSANKRNFEIGNLYTKIFDMCDHYKVGTFCIEELNIKSKVTDNNPTEFNRLVKNVWNLSLHERLVQKHCIERGIIYREVNAVYSSVIGNVRYDYPDPICAAVEIGWRGSNRYDKGKNQIIRFQGELVEDAVKRRIKMDFRKESMSSWHDLSKIVGRSTRVGVGDYPDVRCSPLTSKRTNIIRQSMTERISPLMFYV